MDHATLQIGIDVNYFAKFDADHDVDSPSSRGQL